ncbi:ATP-binding protein [Myroides phaeus]|uniref:ATP-binding protein n=1 Tax=Myroides phaeus TaxID=702745 RepID=UPI002DB8E6D6|nr:ATP-binding protein [Myroides phaeus]MEC4117228.1 ATP-binding protein [Myroides phaeus]
MKPSRSIKTKILFLYFTLFIAVIFSGAYIYKEAKKFTIPEEQVVEENNKIFLVSSTINNLYSSEAYSRSAILTGNQSDINLYYKELDTIVKQIDLMQKQVQDPITISKLNSVKELLAKKKVSFKNIIKARKELSEDTKYTEAFSEIYNIREEIENKAQPIVIQSKEKEKRSAWARLFKGDNTDTIKTTINYPRVSDSLINAMEKIITSTQAKINEQQKKLLQQEQKLLQENKNITNQLREILQNVEQNILVLSYQKINESKSRISTASTNIAYLGGSALIVIIILGWIIIRDLNQTQEYRVALEKLNQEKEVLLRSKTMLFATVTHDLQTPLGSLIGFADLLDQTPLQNKQKQYVANIKSSSQYITNLVNDLTDFSRLENNKISIQKENINIKELIFSTCQVLIPSAENKKISLTWEVDEALDQKFYTDPYRIKQILTNLITNAIKFTQNGGVSVKAFVENDTIQILVNDTGIGIDNSEVDNIFKEFKQAHDGIEKKFGGTGLGLNISKRLIELLDGTIAVESKLGEGSTFSINLPAVIMAEEQEIEHTENTQKRFDILQNNTIAVVDDDKIQLQLMEEILTPLFKEVLLIDDSTEVVQIISDRKVDILLTDIQMPKLDGFELIQAIKQEDKLTNIPIIALSGKRDITEEEFITSGFTAAHPKPLQLEELLMLISNILYPDNSIESIKPTVINESKTNQNKAYNTDTLIQFIGPEKEALRKILVIFLDSTKENILDMHYAAEDFDLDTLGNIAHKMLPMFRQLEINNVIPLLEDLENHSISFDKQEEVSLYITTIEQEINTILALIKEENF